MITTSMSMDAPFAEVYGQGAHFLEPLGGNNAEAVALRDCLVSPDWDDLFLDLDPRGLRAGE